MVHGRVRQAEDKPRPQVSDRFVSTSCTAQQWVQGLVTSQTSTINTLGQRQVKIFYHSRANYFFHFSLVAAKHAKQNILKNEKIEWKFKD